MKGKIMATKEQIIEYLNSKDIPTEGLAWAELQKAYAEHKAKEIKPDGDEFLAPKQPQTETQSVPDSEIVAQVMEALKLQNDTKAQEAAVFGKDVFYKLTNKTQKTEFTVSGVQVEGYIGHLNLSLRKAVMEGQKQFTVGEFDIERID
jgi:hypothetical protein